MASHTTSGAGLRRRRHAAKALPSRDADLAAGMQGLSQLAGNRAMIALLARRRGADPADAVWGDPHVSEADARSLEDDERALARLRLLLDRGEGVLAGLEDETERERAYRRARGWLLELVEALDESFAAGDDYRGELLELLERLEELPENAGANRAAWVAKIADALRAAGEAAHRDLAAKLPSPGGERRPLDAARALGRITRELMPEVERMKREAQLDRPDPDRKRKEGGGEGLALGGAAGAIGLLGARKRKRRAKRRS